MEIFGLIVLLITAGAVAGLTAGLFGNGGGFAVVPALVLLFSILDIESENLIFVGFQSGSLSEMFEKLAFYFKDEIDNSRSSLLSIIEPLILIVMGSIITLIILAILLPIMQMNNSILS